MIKSLPNKKRWKRRNYTIGLRRNASGRIQDDQFVFDGIYWG